MDETGRARSEPTPLRKALREARIEVAERSAVIVELRDAEAARLEILNDAIEPIFKEIAAEHSELFDRGLTQGSTPRLWVDNVAHVTMGRDKRTYRFLLDTFYGRKVLAESTKIEPMVSAITRYVARRIVAREQSLVALTSGAPQRWTASLPAFVIGVVAAIAILFAAALLFAPRWSFLAGFDRAAVLQPPMANHSSKTTPRPTASSPRRSISQRQRPASPLIR
jgi:hypothetical protein